MTRAVKVIHPELAGNREARQRFVREAAILMKLNHPGIVQVRTSSRRTGGSTW